MLSNTAEYALRAVLHLADCSRERPVQASEVAKALDLPTNYLSKILHRLTQEGILDSRRGPQGGFRLAEAPRELTLARVIEPFDALTARRECLLGRPRCTDEAPCPAHDRWKQVFGEVREFFEGTTVADLLRQEEAV